MNIFKKWWKKGLEIPGWDSGTKHPETHPVIFKNVWGYDLLRRVLPGRCHECGFVVPTGVARQELVYTCDKPNCECSRTGNQRMHPVCNVCYCVFHSLYLNYGLKNDRYFRSLHEDEIRERNSGKNRMGL